MQYNGYEIQITEDGFIIRDGSGKYIDCACDEPDAKEIIDDLNAEGNDPVEVVQETKTDWYRRFDKYCSRLKGKCYPTTDPKKFGTVYGTVLDRFIKSFEESTKTTVRVNIEMIDGELFHIVDEVY